jgi:hypothetical protein
MSVWGGKRAGVSDERSELLLNLGQKSQFVYLHDNADINAFTLSFTHYLSATSSANKTPISLPLTVTHKTRRNQHLVGQRRACHHQIGVLHVQRHQCGRVAIAIGARGGELVVLRSDDE